MTKWPKDVGLLACTMFLLFPLNIKRGHGAWNVREINGIAKGEGGEDVFRKRKFELLALNEKLIGNGEVSWCGMSGGSIIVQEAESAREVVA